jgi:glycosyltransferase involved in cell wall biosynthesis
VVPAGDAVAFATALSSLVEDEELRETLAAFGPLRAAGFSLARLAEGTEETYRRVLAELPGEGTSFLSA